MSNLPSGWIETTVGEVTNYVSRGKSPKYAERSSLPIVNQRAIRWFGIQQEHLKFVHPDQFPQWTEERFIREGDILWNSTGTGTIGRACLVKMCDLSPPKVVDSHVTIVRPERDVIESRYLFAWIRGPEVQHSIEDLATGTTNQIELNRATVVRARVPLAPLAEQKRIADKLDALLARLDACREHLDRVPGILKRFRQAVLAAAASGELTREWREERGLDKTWRSLRIEDVANVGTGSTPLRSNGAFYSATGIPWVTSAATSQPLVTMAEEFITEAAVAAHRLKLYPIGTLVVAMYGEGKTRGQVTELGIEATINQACAAIVIDETKATRAFVRLALESNYLEMRQLAEGGNQPNLNLSKIKTFPLSLPPMEEQYAIVERVEAMMRCLIGIQERSRTAAQATHRLLPAILTKAFSGNLVSQDPSDEPAGGLLARTITSRAIPPQLIPRKPRPQRVPRALKEGSAMTKSRQDEDVKGRPYLAEHLRKLDVPCTAETLFKEAQLPVADFYKQLAWEVAQGHIKDNRDTLEPGHAAG